MQDKKFIRPKALCDYLEIDIQTLYRKVRERKIPHRKRLNKLYFDIDEINSWLDAGKPETIEVSVK